MISSTGSLNFSYKLLWSAILPNLLRPNFNVIDSVEVGITIQVLQKYFEKKSSESHVTSIKLTYQGVSSMHVSKYYFRNFVNNMYEKVAHAYTRFKLALWGTVKRLLPNSNLANGSLAILFHKSVSLTIVHK